MSRGHYTRTADAGRGHYAEQDSLLVAWTAGRAVEKRIAPLRGKAWDAIHAVEAAHEGAQAAFTGSSAFRDRGAKSVTQVGGEWWHGLADRATALRIIGDGFTTLRADVMQFVDAAADHVPNAAAIARWLEADVAPAIAEWQRFVTRERDSVVTQALTAWSVYEDWRKRLVHLRELARAHGVELHSPEPAQLPQTIWQKSASGTGDTASSVLGAVRLVVLGVVGVWGALKLMRALREMRDMAAPAPVVAEPENEAATV